MTVEEWLACKDPSAMLIFLGRRYSDRKWRLFACACSRLIWVHLGDERSRKAVEVAEAYAEGQAGWEELRQAGDEAVAVWTEMCSRFPQAGGWSVQRVAAEVAAATTSIVEGAE